MKKLLLILLIALSLVLLFLFKDKFFKVSEKINQTEVTNKVSEDKLEIISTKPDSLEGAVILPTQEIEFKFNKQISISEFKHKFDPEVEHKVNATYDKVDNTTIISIKFSEALSLGSGYTLFILPNTNSEDGKVLGREFSYHFSTIKYKGV